MHVEILQTKLGRANVWWTFGSKVILRKIYFAAFGADFCHECQICGEKDIYKYSKIKIMQNKILCILILKDHQNAVCHYKILKLVHVIGYNKVLFTFDQINNKMVSNAFEDYFQIKRQQHSHFTRVEILNVPWSTCPFRYQPQFNNFLQQETIIIKSFAIIIIIIIYY